MFDTEAMCHSSSIEREREESWELCRGVCVRAQMGEVTTLNSCSLCVHHVSESNILFTTGCPRRYLSAGMAMVTFQVFCLHKETKSVSFRTQGSGAGGLTAAPVRAPSPQLPLYTFFLEEHVCR